MLRFNLLRDRRAERFAKALLGDESNVLTVNKIREAAQAARNSWFADMMDKNTYAMVVSPKNLQQLKEMPGMEQGETQGIRVIENPFVESGRVYVKFDHMYGLFKP